MGGPVADAGLCLGCDKHVTLVLGPPSRPPYVHATIGQLRSRGFPAAKWLRAPSPEELQECVGPNLQVCSKGRVMMLWRTTLLPAVQEACEKYKCSGAMVVEDTVLLRPEVAYADVAADVERGGAAAGVWG